METADLSSGIAGSLVEACWHSLYTTLKSMLRDASQVMQGKQIKSISAHLRGASGGFCSADLLFKATINTASRLRRK
eukprot:6196085-Pleurochrysis_carterae.AAC.2